MNFFAYLHEHMSGIHGGVDRDLKPLPVFDVADFKESEHRRVAKGSKGGGQFAEKPETKAKKDEADLLDKNATSSDTPFLASHRKRAFADKIYATSDIHHTGIEDIDDKESGTIILAGDFMDRAKEKYDYPGAEKWWKETFLPWCKEHKDQNIVIIGGNGDMWLYDNRNNIDWPSNVHYLDDSAANVNGMKIYGTSWSPSNKGNGAWEIPESQLEKKYDAIPYGLDVLITHAPPAIDGSDIDYDDVAKRHCGSEALTKAILEKKPKLVLCGHIHRGSHKPVKLGDTTVINVSRVETDRYERSFHGRKVGIERTGSGLGFLVDMDDEARKQLGKKEDYPDSIIKLRDALRRAEKSISKGRKYGDGPDPAIIKEAEQSIEDAKSDMAEFDHEKKGMIVDAIRDFMQSKGSGFSKRMKHVGILYDGDKNGKGEWVGTRDQPDEPKDPWHGHGGGGGNSSRGGRYSQGYLFPNTPVRHSVHSPWWSTPAWRPTHEPQKPADQPKRTGMSLADILAGKGRSSSHYWSGVGKK